MRLLKRTMIFTLILCMMATNMVFAEGRVKSSVTSKKVEIPSDEIYYKVAKRVYDNFNKGITTTELGLKGVDANKFLSFENRQYMHKILIDLRVGIIKIEAKQIGDVAKITIQAGKISAYENSKELDKKLEELAKEVSNKSSIKSKLGYINDKISEEATYVSGGTAEDVLVKGRGVCSAFSDTVLEVCEMLGVKAVPMHSRRKKHESNLVYIDGKWYIWDLTWNNGKHGHIETVYETRTTEDGEIEFITGPRNRQYFLLDPKSNRGKMYLENFAITNEELGTVEALISIKYPKLGNMDLDLGDIEVDVESLEEENKNQDNSTQTPVNNNNTNTTVTQPIDNTPAPDVGKIVLDGQGNVILDTINNPKDTQQDVEQTPNETVEALPTSSSVLVNGKKVAFEAYNIKGNNYFKLRDIAMALNGTEKQFIVGWDAQNNSISIVPGGIYTPVGGELQVSGNMTARTGTSTKSRIFLDGVEVKFTAYNIGGNNYFKLRDIGKALNFGVFWDGENNMIKIDTSVGYSE